MDPITKTEQIINQLNQDTPNQQQLTKAPKSFDKQHHDKMVAIWKFVGKFGLIVLTLLTFFRVPFVGSYFDGLFDYLFGFGKYFFYCLVIFVLIGWTFNTGYTRIVKTRKFVIFSSIALICACCVVSGVTGMISTFKNPVAFDEMIKQYHSHWITYFKGWHYTSFFNYYVTGGILAELISYVFTFLSFVILIIVALIILAISILVIFNINYKSTKIGLKLRGWMIRKLGGTFKHDGFNELKSKKENQNKFKKANHYDIEAIAQNNSSIPFDLLPATDLNKYDENFRNARRIQNRLINLFKNNNIDAVATDINIFTAYCEVCFEAKTKDDVQAILSLQKNIAKVAKIDHFNISLRGNIINIEIENDFFSKLSLKTALGQFDKGIDTTAIVGLDKQKNLLIQNWKNEASALILGEKNSGAATAAVIMALSTCYITAPDKLELVILNPNYEQAFAAFSSLPHSDGKVYETLNACNDKLHDLQKIVNDRISLLKVNNVDNIDQYNQAMTNQANLKHILVVIPNFNSLLRETFQNNKILAEILANGAKTGVYLIMQSYVANNDVLDKEIFDNISNKYIFRLSSQEESLRIFDNYRGHQLHGNGDCLSFNKDKISAMKRVQICNINFAELNSDIDIIKTFYEAKQKIKEEKILAEVKENEIKQ